MNYAAILDSWGRYSHTLQLQTTYLCIHTPCLLSFRSLKGEAAHFKGKNRFRYTFGAFFIQATFSGAFVGIKVPVKFRQGVMNHVRWKI